MSYLAEQIKWIQNRPTLINWLCNVGVSRFKINNNNGFNYEKNGEYSYSKVIPFFKWYCLVFQTRVGLNLLYSALLYRTRTRLQERLQIRVGSKLLKYVVNYNKQLASTTTVVFEPCLPWTTVKTPMRYPLTDTQADTYWYSKPS